MVRTISSRSLTAGAARRRSGRCKGAGKRGRRSDSPVGNIQQGRKQQRVCNDSVLPSKRHIADEEDDDYNDDERGDDDDIATTYTADSAIVDEENDHKDEESEDEESDNSAAEEQQVMVRNQRQRSSVSSTSGRIRDIPASTSRNCQSSAGNSTRHSSGTGTAPLRTGQQRSGVSGNTIPVGVGVATVSFGTNSVSSATTGSAVTPRTMGEFSSDGNGVLDTSNSGNVATSTASEGQGPTADNTYRTASAITYRGNHDVLQDQTFIRLPREVAETNRTANFLKERIQKFCKKELFKKVKFVASDSGLQHVMARMAGIFQIPMAKKQAFKSQFKKIVMDSLNAKRAFCEQQAGKVVLSK
jgi:hypothetical protein